MHATCTKEFNIEMALILSFAPSRGFGLKIWDEKCSRGLIDANRREWPTGTSRALLIEK